ncbi:UNVERIFIED_ORG: hypothetical protein E4P37_04180 [Bacillus sp. AZ43]
MTVALEHLTAAAENHHEDLRDRLVWYTETLIAAVATRQPHEAARAVLLEFLRDELLAHTEVEDGLLFTSAEGDRTALLAAAMQDEHRMVASLVCEIEQTTDAMDLVIAAGALVVLFDVCVHQENRYLLPALAAAGVDLEGLLVDVPEIVGVGGER